MDFRYQLRYQLTKILRCSHKQADAYCRNGQIEINQIVTSDPRIKIGYHEQIKLKGEIIRKGTELKYVLFYKPNHYECTTNRAVENNMYEVLPLEYQDLFAIGRLDKNSEGLLLLTNDGSFYKAMMGNEVEIEKEYIVQAYFPVTDSLRHSFENSFQLGQRFTLPAQFEQVNECCFKVILKEGINRQIRRILAKNNNRVKQLIRVRFGNFKLEKMHPGQCIELADRPATG